MKNVIREFRRMGFKVLGASKPKTANGPDLFAVKDERVYSVEVKHARMQGKIASSVRPVEQSRRNDDLIAIVFPSGYVLIEPMKDHLSRCSKAGGRMCTPLC